MQAAFQSNLLGNIVGMRLALRDPAIGPPPSILAISATVAYDTASVRRAWTIRLT